ncbi:energy-coupling factor transporter ATPase [Paenibacillus sp. FSL K6-1230]|uniref:energy-coupling factor transporter ATPase n=1 Tax=Paenibacillus sp. FSL K6-1230 TaxID=2921603 RepID=UPI0030F73B32
METFFTAWKRQKAGVMLTIDNVLFYYRKGQTILDQISLTIRPGEFVAIVGGNGSGKSTLARLMNGLVLPKSGRVKLAALDTSVPAELNEIRQQIGLVFQNPDDQFITTTVMDEILFGMENIRVPRKEMDVRLQHALQSVQMEEYAEAMPHQLSGGQKQRVAIAAIIAMQPRILILDEATSMLDPHSRQQIMSIVQQLYRQGMTIIHITHHMEEVLSADRVLLLDQGQIVFDGEPATMFATVPLADYKLEQPFAARLHQWLHMSTPLTADWKEMIRSQWSMK